MISELDILKLMQKYGDETELADFSPDELKELLDRMEAGLEDGEPLPTDIASFKERYFAYYDDVKDKSLKKQDW